MNLDLDKEILREISQGLRSHTKHTNIGKADKKRVLGKLH